MNDLDFAEVVVDVHVHVGVNDVVQCSSVISSRECRSEM